MAGNRQYLSFLSNLASSNGVLSIKLQTAYAQTNTTITLAVTGIGVSALADAATAFIQIGTQLSQYNLNYTGSPSFSSNMVLDTQGSPVFSSQLGQGTYRIALSDHIISFFSEANFSLTILSNTGGTIQASNTPTLVTIENAKLYAPIAQTDLTGLTDTQIAILLQLSSSKLTSLLNNAIVVSTYVQDFIGYMQRSLFLRLGLPGIYYDNVRVKRPGEIFFQPYLGTYLSWNYNRDNGELNYIPAQNLINTMEPTAWGNEIRISYVAGYYSIPTDIAFGVVAVMQTVLENTGNVESLKTGTWGVKFRASALNEIVAGLSGYALYG